MRRLHLEGQRFGKLLVLGLAERSAWSRQETEWLCLCECGTTTQVRRGDLRHGKTRSCGAGPCRDTPGRPPEHGRTKTPEFKAWSNMKDRCLNSRNKQWKNYGARGITVCTEWRDSFDMFYEHVGPRPAKGLSLDRIDNDGDYEPGNVRWADAHTQQNNRKRRRKHCPTCTCGH